MLFNHFKRTFFVYLALLSLSLKLAHGISFNTPELSIGLHAHYGGGKQLPFWLLSNQYGKYDTDKTAILSSIAIFGRGDTLGNWDFQYGLEGVGRINQGASTAWLHQAFGRADYRKFLRFQAGMWEETLGNQYTPLSSGSIIWSQNARPMPKVEIGSAGYVDVPFTKGIFQVKGALAHGWFEKDRYVEGVWLHQKYAAARTRFDFPLNFNFTFHHFAMWGGNHPVFGQLPSSISDYPTVFFVGKGGEDAPETEQLNRYGNHIGSRNYGINWQQPSYAIDLYFQDIYEDGSGARWKNFPDGLWGVVWKNSNTVAPIVAVLYEYLHTIDQSGPIHQAVGLPGDDNYFNHGIYDSGLTFNQMTIGTPFITSPIYNQQIDHPSNHRIWNNRVVVHHIGVHGNIRKNVTCLMRASYANNFGLHSGMGVPDEILSFKIPHKELHWMIEFGYKTKNPALRLNFKIASDRGKVYGNNIAGVLELKYIFF